MLKQKQKNTSDGVDFLHTGYVPSAIISPDPYDQSVPWHSGHLVEKLQALLVSFRVEDARLQQGGVSSRAQRRVKLHVVARI